MNTETIYVVTSGEYSDYHIEGLYESLELAREAHGEGCEIEKWPINTDIQEKRAGLKRFYVTMLRDGTVCSLAEYWEDDREPTDRPPTIHFEYKTKQTLAIARFEMWARDEQHAIKIANERRIQLIAKNEWEPSQ